jgi:(p)ppGpp synthase/HD superfamily hydrolase
MTYPLILDSALIFAARAHRDQVRKGTQTPYIVHPVGVMLILEQAGEHDPQLLAAALLHDTIEDAGVSAETLAERFGPRVAEIVVGCSEPNHDADAWEARKQHTVGQLRTASREVQLVAAADKLHNLNSMVIDHGEQGERLWSRFNRGRTDIEWYYRAIAASLSAGELRDHLMVRPHPPCRSTPRAPTPRRPAPGASSAAQSGTARRPQPGSETDKHLAGDPRPR